MLRSDIQTAQITAGDGKSFANLHKLLYDRMFFYAYKILGDPGECEELIQDTFIRYWENKGDFEDLAAVKVYLYRTLNFKIMNLSRKKQRQYKLINEIPVRDYHLEDHLIISSEIAAQVRQAIDELPPQTSRVMKLSLLEMGQEEIAAEMGISVNTVKMLKKAGYKVLRKNLAHLKLILSFLIS